MSRRRSAPGLKTIKFSIYMPTEELVEDEAWTLDEPRKRQVIAAGYVTKGSAVSAKGWETLNAARDKIEKNLVRWMNGFFKFATITGIENGVTVGKVAVDPNNADQVEVAEDAYGLGISIDADWPEGIFKTTFEGVNEFAVVMLGSDTSSVGLSFEEPAVQR